LGQLAAIRAYEEHRKERTLPDGTKTWVEGFGIWELLRGDPEHAELALCPAASRLRYEMSPGTRYIYGDTFHAYRSEDRGSAGNRVSYGQNGWINIYGDSDPSRGRRWYTFEERGASRIPVFFDCATQGVKPYHLCPPHELEDIFFAYQLFSDVVPGENVTVMSPVCMNRHNGGVNMLFMDWSVRKVGLKELWTLKWSPEFDTAGPWTKAGGALPEDWPKWMRGFKDY
jgi:prepilin-type processing-associated H-X9-DG protein